MSSGRTNRVMIRRSLTTWRILTKISRSSPSRTITTETAPGGGIGRRQRDGPRERQRGYVGRVEFHRRTPEIGACSAWCKVRTWRPLRGHRRIVEAHRTGCQSPSRADRGGRGGRDRPGARRPLPERRRAGRRGQRPDDAEADVRRTARLTPIQSRCAERALDGRVIEGTAAEEPPGRHPAVVEEDVLGDRPGSPAGCSRSPRRIGEAIGNSG